MDEHTRLSPVPPTLFAGVLVVPDPPWTADMLPDDEAIVSVRKRVEGSLSLVCLFVDLAIVKVESGFDKEYLEEEKREKRAGGT